MSISCSRSCSQIPWRSHRSSVWEMSSEWERVGSKGHLWQTERVVCVTLWVGRCVDTHAHTHRSLEQLSSIHPSIPPSIIFGVPTVLPIARVTVGGRQKHTLYRSLIHPGEGHTGGGILQLCWKYSNFKISTRIPGWWMQGLFFQPASAVTLSVPQNRTHKHLRTGSKNSQEQSRLQRGTFSFLITACTSCARVSSQRPLLRNEAFQVPHPGVPFISFVDSFRGSSDGNSNKTTFPGSPRPTGPGPFPRKWIYIQLKFWALGVKVMLDYLRLFSVQQTHRLHTNYTHAHTLWNAMAFSTFFLKTQTA